MSNFWLSGTGVMPTGLPQDSFVGDFSVIPEGTQAKAKIADFVLIEKENKYTGSFDKYYQVTFKLEDGDFKNREVSLKIRCFSGDSNKIQRNLSFLKLVLQLCNYQPVNNDAPTNESLRVCVGKLVSIKIGEYSITKDDGTTSDGNFVREVHAVDGLTTETGVKKYRTPVESALTRNADRQRAKQANDEDVPF